MKKTLFVAGAILLLATLQFGDTLGNQKQVAKVTGGVRWSQCAFDPTGLLWVVFEEDTIGAGHPVWVVNYDGTKVSTPYNATGAMNIRGLRPGIGAGPSGMVVVAWGVDEPVSQVWIRIWDPETKEWRDKELVAQGEGFEEPNVAIDKDDNIHVAWFNMSGAHSWVRSKIGGAWTAPTYAGQGKDCTVAVGSNGTAYVVWREKGAGGNYKMFYRTRTSTTGWTAAEAVGEGGNSASHPGVTVGPNNVAIIAWGNIDESSGGGVEMRIIKILPGANREVVWPGSLAHYPRLVVDKNLHYHMVCQLGAGDGGSGLRYAKKTGDNWSGAQVIHSGMNKVVGISTDPFGNVAACMSGMGTEGSVVTVWSTKRIDPAPILNAEFTFTPTSGSYPLPVTFTATKVLGDDGKEVTYDWDFGDGGTATGRTVTHTYNTKGTFDIVLTITDDDGRQNHETKSIDVDETPLPEPEFTFSPTTGYWPLLVYFTATKALGPDGTEVTYNWNFGDGGAGSGRKTSHTFATKGTFNIVLTITDNVGRSDSVTKQITVENTPLPEPDFTFSPTTGYPPLPVNFTATKAEGPDGTEVIYVWGFGDGGTGAGRKTSHTFQTHGKYNVSLTITDNIGRSDSVTKQITILKTNPLVPVGLSATIVLSQFWQSPEITFNLFWQANPDNVPAHVQAYAIYMKEDSGEYVRILTVSPSTLSASFKFTDLSKKRAFAVSTLGYGGTESPLGYF